MDIGDGRLYSGSMLDNKLRQGYGVLKSSGGEVLYEGQWDMNMKNGRAKDYTMEGGLYKGEYLEGKT
jgi:hypothetical protein